MKKHQIIFEKIKELLRRHFGDELKEYEEGTYLTIGESGIWILCEEQGLAVGYGLVHTH